jgi:NAD:arginine ADP-ribosyltransferase
MNFKKWIYSLVLVLFFTVPSLAEKNVFFGEGKELLQGAGSLWKSFLDDAFTLQKRADVIADGLPAQFPNLSIDELTAIKVYTSDQMRNGSKIYQTLNTELRAGNLSDYNKGLNDLVNSGLGKLSPHSGATVFRGCGQAESQLAKTWKVGDDITFKDFKSTSINENTATNFMNSGSGDVIYEIANPKGYNICNISCLPGEAEILFKSGAKFKVTELTYLPRFDPSDPLVRVVKMTFIP